MSRYRMGELVNGFRVGDKRKKFGTDDYEVFAGDQWVEEWLFDENNHKEPTSYFDSIKVNECDGCEDDPFCSCQSMTKTEREIAEIRKLVALSDSINKEILNRLDAIVTGGDSK